MAEVRLKENESLDSALRRFKRQCARSGVLAELRKREHYEKPSVKRKKKSEAARKRKYKKKSMPGSVCFPVYFFVLQIVGLAVKSKVNFSIARYRKTC